MIDHLLVTGMNPPPNLQITASLLASISGQKMIEIAPSILAADFTRLGQQVSDALSCGVKIDNDPPILAISAQQKVVELIGIEPTTPCLQSRCSPS